MSAIRVRTVFLAILSPSRSHVLKKQLISALPCTLGMLLVKRSRNAPSARFLVTFLRRLWHTCYVWIVERLVQARRRQFLCLVQRQIRRLVQQVARPRFLLPVQREVLLLGRLRARLELLTLSRRPVLRVVRLRPLRRDQLRIQPVALLPVRQVTRRSVLRRVRL